MARAAAMEMGCRGCESSRYEWEEKRNDDLWVMETLGNRRLRKACPKVATKAQDAQGPAPAVCWRQKCKAEGFDPGCHCLCKRFDPVVMLPSSLFSEHDVNKDVHRAALQLLEDAQGTIPGDFQKADMELDVSEQMCHLTELRCHAVCFRVRKRVRHVFVEAARSRAAERDQQGREGEAAVLRLDRLEFEANMYLLHELVAWCDQFRAVKGHNVSQQRLVAQKKHEEMAEAEMRRTKIDTRLRFFDAAGVPDVPGVPGHRDEERTLAWPPGGGTADSKAFGFVPRPDTATSNDSQATRKSLARTGTPATPGRGMTASQAVLHFTTRGQGAGPEAPGRAILCCRCGHSAIWHEEPEAYRAKAPYVAPWLQKSTKHGRSTSVAYAHARPSTPPGQSAVIVGGALRKAGSMVSLQKL